LNAKQLGEWGEAIALDFLLKKNYSFVAKCFRSRFGEIDLIVNNQEFIVFAEVKLRKNADFAQAREYIGKTKQNKIRATAGLWLSLKETLLQPRFDVIEIYAPDGFNTKLPDIIHIENAF